MTVLLSTSTAIPAPKSQNAYIGIPTPQKSVESSAYMSGFRAKDLAELPLPGGELKGLGKAEVEVVNPVTAA